jgi:VanZ family protein
MAWIVIILTLSSIPSLPTLKIVTRGSVIRLDYLMHFCVYGLLAFLAYLTYADAHFNLNFRKFIIITAGLILFALADEFHQKLIPGRSFNVKDIYSNIAGIIAALGFCLAVLRHLKKYGQELDQN